MTRGLRGLAAVGVAALAVSASVSAVMPPKASGAIYYCWFGIYHPMPNTQWSVRARVRSRYCFNVVSTVYYGWGTRRSENVGSIGGGGAPHFNVTWPADCYSGTYQSNPYTTHLSVTITAPNGNTKTGGGAAGPKWISCNGVGPMEFDVHKVSALAQLLDPDPDWFFEDEYGTGEEIYVEGQDG